MKYKYAHDENKQVVCIDSAYKFKTYSCINCGEVMRPRQGDVYIHHFYHYVKADRVNHTLNCSPEHYIHKLAKELFFSAYKDNTTFHLRRNRKQLCSNSKATSNCHKLEPSIINLISKYPNIEIEKKDDGFVPDILLSNDSGDKLYIEFAYTHSVEKKKANSGNKIAEIKIKTEQDVHKIIKNSLIDASDKNVSLYGFETESFNCNGECLYEDDAKYIRNGFSKVDINEVSSSSIESYYNKGEYKFLLKKIIYSRLPPAGFAHYDIPTIKKISYEIYLDGKLIGSSRTQNEALEIVNKHVLKLTPPSLFD